MIRNLLLVVAKDRSVAKLSCNSAQQEASREGGGGAPPFPAGAGHQTQGQNPCFFLQFMHLTNAGSDFPIHGPHAWCLKET